MYVSIFAHWVKNNKVSICFSFLYLVLCSWAWTASSINLDSFFVSTCLHFAHGVKNNKGPICFTYFGRGLNSVIFLISKWNESFGPGGENLTAWKRDKTTLWTILLSGTRGVLGFRTKTMYLRPGTTFHPIHDAGA